MIGDDCQVQGTTYHQLEVKATPKCQQMIRCALVNYAYDKGEESLVAKLVSVGEALLGSRWLASGIGFSLAGLMVFGVVVGWPHQEGKLARTSQARALEVVGQMQEQVAELDPEEKLAIENLIAADVDDCLMELLEADDLQLLDNSEVAPLVWGSWQAKKKRGTQVVVATASLASLERTKSNQEAIVGRGGWENLPTPLEWVYLKYSRSDGRVVILGVNEHGLPVFRWVGESTEIVPLGEKLSSGWRLAE